MRCWIGHPAKRAVSHTSYRPGTKGPGGQCRALIPLLHGVGGGVLPPLATLGVTAEEIVKARARTRNTFFTVITPFSNCPPGSTEANDSPA
jgi:hypothetical protein